MTGLHALHVLGGMTAFVWVLRRAVRGDFSEEYFTPVELTALYWHLVDLVWIYLFPLLYLIR
jgi:cytochrome c oxidase subunit 3